MKKLAGSMALVVITAWVGGLWGVGYVAVPVLFQALPDRMLAGILAGEMFTLIAYIGIASACYLLIYQLSISGKATLGHPVSLVIIAMLLLTIVVQFGIQPIMADLKAQALPIDVMHSTFADRFRMLHGIASIAYLVQSLLGIALVLKTRRC